MDAMLKAVSDLGYQPSRHGPVKAHVSAGKVKVGAVQKGKLRAGKSGEIEVHVKGGGKFAVKASHEGLGIDASQEGSGKVKVSVDVPEGAKAGDHDLTVTVTVGEQELSLKLPIQIE